MEEKCQVLTVDVPEEPVYDGYADVNINLGSGVGAGRSGCCSC